MIDYEKEFTIDMVCGEWMDKYDLRVGFMRLYLSINALPFRMEGDKKVYKVEDLKKKLDEVSKFYENYTWDTDPDKV